MHAENHEPPFETLTPEKILAAEERRERAERLFTFLEKIKAQDVLKDEESRMRFFRELSFEELKEWLNRLQGIINGEPIAERELIDEGEMRVDRKDGSLAYLAPQSNRKEPLLQEVFEESKKLTSSKDIALLYSAEIQALHFSRDGNGRLSRLLYCLFSKDHTFDEADREEIENAIGPRDEVLTTSTIQMIERALLSTLASRFAKVDFGSDTEVKGMYSSKSAGDLAEVLSERRDLNETHLRVLHLLLDDGDFGFLALTAYLKKEKIATEELTEEIPPGPSSIKGRAFVMPRIIEKLTAEQVTGLGKYYLAFKDIYIRLVADVIVNPKQYKNPYPEGGETLKEYYEYQIERTREYRAGLSGNKTK